MNTCSLAAFVTSVLARPLCGTANPGAENPSLGPLCVPGQSHAIGCLMHASRPKVRHRELPAPEQAHSEPTPACGRSHRHVVTCFCDVRLRLSLRSCRAHVVTKPEAVTLAPTQCKNPPLAASSTLVKPKCNSMTGAQHRRSTCNDCCHGHWPGAPDTLLQVRMMPGPGGLAPRQSRFAPGCA